MSKVMTVTYNDKDYTLEYTRRSVQAMERQGFDINAVSSKPATMMPLLLRGAFKAHHKDMRDDEIDEICDSIGVDSDDREAFIAKLVEMYSEPVLALMEGTKGNEKNATWKASW